MQEPASPHGYYRMREVQELDLAAKAHDPAVRHIHLTLAAKYRELHNGEDLLDGEDPIP